MRLLIDECLSEELAKLARERGHLEASHVRWIGKGGAKDWELMPVILEGDWTFVTKNSIDFRGPANAPGGSGEYVDIDLHAGLICLNGPVGMDLDMQMELFEVALDDLDTQSDLVNQVLEITLSSETDADIRIVRYSLPAEG
ncbi:DUF5615 family PIN-like protein [Magnetospirillum fulvum]|uniref:DUF5615 domain-containing protein n=1 Tax=Magnetospirillum fulvum TaxID=1082 RepID=A0A1H6I6F1_MAGFU|nr:DUF5615 family PIN-like protein [Magnetospirillum fulvum]SEH41934.1 hypothetical protein SAMN04244559_02239 [Magnetospirillum fulvum]SEH59505.1 hypothetical protein SAMN04244559_03105 [Magnetospirillum fulvum]SEH65557.1 hypothetical protein SAMN04244559_03333 [Magnetospirillum fulvum]